MNTSFVQYKVKAIYCTHNTIASSAQRYLALCIFMSYSRFINEHIREAYNKNESAGDNNMSTNYLQRICIQ